AGQPHPLDAEAREHADQAPDLLVREHLGAGQPVEPLGGHAVGAPVVAPVRDADPQVRVPTREAVDPRAVARLEARDRRRQAHERAPTFSATRPAIAANAWAIASSPSAAGCPSSPPWRMALRSGSCPSTSVS